MIWLTLCDHNIREYGREDGSPAFILLHNNHLLSASYVPDVLLNYIVIHDGYMGDILERYFDLFWRKLVVSIHLY